MIAAKPKKNHSVMQRFWFVQDNNRKYLFLIYRNYPYQLEDLHILDNICSFACYCYTYICVMNHPSPYPHSFSYLYLTSHILFYKHLLDCRVWLLSPFSTLTLARWC